MNTKVWLGVLDILGKVLILAMVVSLLFPLISANAQVSWNNGDVIQIGPYDIFVMLDGQRHHIPNPETLDAMHISRTQINNKGLNDDQLRAIPQGSDVPDVARDPGGFNDFMNRLYSSPPPQQNPAGNFNTADVIQIGDAIYVIVNGQRDWVPNPATLDALGIPRSWVNNKGFDGNQLSFIPRGPDIPDVNRDYNGFIAFKNAIFPNTTWINPPVQATQPPAPPQANPADSFNTGEVIITSDGRVWVIVNRERRWVPNPATLDALGISRTIINNKGFGDSQLYSIPQGADIPDVNRDPNGFWQFKNAIYPGNAPINPPAPTSIPAYEGICSGWNGRMTVGQPGRVTYTDGSPTRLRAAPSRTAEILRSMPEGYVFDVVGGPVCADGWTWWKLRTQDGVVGWSAEGNSSSRFIEPWSQVIQPTATPWEGPVATPWYPTATPKPNPTAVPQPTSEPTVEPIPNGPWCLLPGFCNPPEVQASTNTSCKPQCVEEARTHRPDLDKWALGAGTSDNILAIAQNKPQFPWESRTQEVRVRSPNEQPQAGDLVVWPSGCEGAWSNGGHIGYNNANGSVSIIDSNWDNKCSPRNNVPISVQPCVRFITKPFPAGTYQPQTGQPTDKCSRYKWPFSWFCKLGWIK